MPRHVRSTKKKYHRGGSVMNWIKQKAWPFLRDKAIPYIKKNKLASRGLNLIPHPYAKTASKVAATLGYGRRMSRRGGALRMAGGALRM